MKEQQWLPDLPSWVPGWIPWILLGIVVLAWILDKFVFKGFSIANLKTRNKKDALDLVKDERDVWKDRATGLEEKLNKLKEEDKNGSDAIDDRTENEKQKEINEEVEEKEEVLESSEQSSAFSKMLDAFDKGDYQKGLEYLEKEAENSENEQRRLDFLGFSYSIAFEKGIRQAFEDLKKLSKDNPNSPNVAIWLANSYSFINEFQPALEKLENVLEKTEDESSRVSLAIKIANILIQMEQKAKAKKKLKELIKSIDEPNLKARIYKKLGRIFEKQKNYEKAFMFFERALVHNPTDTDLRFDVAYLYSNNSAPKFALYHYRKLLSVKEHKMASNNAGVACGNLSLPILSTKYYKEAEEQGNTLASANLAYKLLDIGFLDEAEEILKKAEAKEDTHENVYKAHGSISERKTNEDKTLEKVIEDVENLRKWRLEFGKAILDEISDPKTFSGTYEGNPGKLKLEVTESGDVTGKLYLNNNKEPAELTGTLKGSGIKVLWKEPPKKQQEKENKLTGLASALSFPKPPRKEEGILILEGKNIQGFTKSGESSLDPTSNIYSTEWDLIKVS